MNGVGIFENNSNTNLSIYPNPATTQLTIDVAAQINNINILDLTGKIVFNSTTNESIIDVSMLSKGIYLLQVNTSNGIATKRFIKE